MEQKSKPADAQVDSAAADAAGVVMAALDRFQVVRNRYLRWLIGYTPIVIGILLLADWLAGPRPGSFAHDLRRLSSMLIVIVALVMLRILFDRVPQDLRLLWTRGLIRSTKGYPDFIAQFEQTLNSRWAWLVGAACALIGFVSTYAMRFLIATGHWPEIDLVSYYFQGNFAVNVVPLGYLIGLLAWRVGVIAYFVSRLGQRFDLAIQPKHPDKCGGLQPLGDWCLTIALLLLLAASYFSFWGVVITFFSSGADQAIDQLWTGWYQQLLVVLSVLAVFLFVQPLYAVHLQMEQRRREIQAELDELSHKIDELMLELRTKADTLTPEQGKQRLETLDFMQKVYDQSKHVPTWPFDAESLWRFVAAQAVPLLGLISTTKPFIPAVQAALAVFQK